MMREYIQRFHSPEKITYIHPVMEEQLKETYGVMVYQEDVLKVAHHFAGLDLSDADILRRAMSGKFRSQTEFLRIKDRFFNNCNERGYKPQITAEVWRQMESFAGYSFSKAHSASYAVESFQSLYLKAHYPLEFMVAVINNFGGFYRSWVYFNEARRWGGNIELPCVNRSTATTNISGKDIYIGFVHIQNLEHKITRSFLEEREQNGSYLSLEDFQRRTHITKEQLIILIRAGAFRFTGQSKSQLLWEAHILTGTDKKSVDNRNLFELSPKAYKLPELESSSLEDAYDEMELLGFPVTIQSFDMLQTSFRGEIFADGMHQHIGKKVRMVGRLVTIKYVRTKSNTIMNFGTFTDTKGEFFDTTHFPASLRDYPFKGNGIYLFLGKIVEEFGFPSMEVEKMAKLPYNPDPRA
jgi:DNA polymerase III alpha subunit